jgi:hypothetical protein
MGYKKKFIQCAIALIIGAFTIFGSSALNPAACAEQVYDVTVCFSLDLNPLVKSPEITIYAMDGKGIMRSNDEGKVFDNCSAHVQGMAMYEGKTLTKTVYMKYLDPDGDFVVFRQTQSPGEKEGTTTILMGTGKWKGITGGGKAVQIAKGKPVVEGTVQFCNSHKGTFTLPQ